MISVNPLYPFLYNHGFIHPSVGFPEAISASLTREMIDAVRGQEADVPEMEDAVRLKTKAK